MFQRVKGNVRGVQGGPTRTLGVSWVQGERQGGPRGSGGVVKVSQGEKRVIRVVPGVKGSLGDPKGLRWTSWAY